MRKIIVSEFVSIDGVMEEPAWTFPFNTSEQNQYKFEELVSCEGLLLGRVTYEGFKAAWPKVTDDTINNDISLPDGFAARMNTCPKYVVTSTRQELDWEGSVPLDGRHAMEEVSRLKQQQGGNLLVAGSRQLVNSLLKHDLVDELRLMIFPIICGKGLRLFEEGTAVNRLKHAETRTFESGVVVVTYRKA